ncbi:ABC transporter permease [Daejeonella sp.]|jgi:hypothetical protein|uniref:ABC transporter permease n=1 Tax=Daejeonella sp. TaxID=2805397 RepID=UPI0037839CF6
MQGFILSLSSEFYKTRKTLAFLSAILLPLILCLLVSVGFYNHAEKMANYSAEMQWMRFSMAFIGVMGSLLLPLIIIFQSFSINNIEHRAEMWKSLFTLPISKWSIYSAKFVYALLLNALCLSLFATLILLSGIILDLLKPELKFNEFNFSAILYKLHLKLFLASTGILAIQFLFSLLWADFLKPMGIGLILTVFGIITANLGWKYAFTIPYTHPMLTINGFMKQAMNKKNELIAFDLMSKEIWFSLAISTATYFIGYYVIRNRSIK